MFIGICRVPRIPEERDLTQLRKMSYDAGVCLRLLGKASQRKGSREQWRMGERHRHTTQGRGMARARGV